VVAVRPRCERGLPGRLGLQGVRQRCGAVAATSVGRVDHEVQLAVPGHQKADISHVPLRRRCGHHPRRAAGIPQVEPGLLVERVVAVRLQGGRGDPVDARLRVGVSAVKGREVSCQGNEEPVRRFLRAH